MSSGKKLAILVGGGPAPGINSVIGAATIRGRLENVEVLGIRDGFHWIMQGNIDHVVPLTIHEVSRIHFRGGRNSASRANPTVDPRCSRTIQSLLRLGVSQLITIGGDDTAFSAMRLAQSAQGRLRVVHVPKTIDNDLELPAYVDTFGYQTARHVRGANRAEPDGRCQDHVAVVASSSRWGARRVIWRSASARPPVRDADADPGGVRRHGAPEEDRRHPGRRRHQAPERRPAMAWLCWRRDWCSRSSRGLRGAGDVERDAHGHVRLAEIDLGDMVRNRCRPG